MADPGPTTWSLLDLPPELLVLIGEALSPDFCGVVALSATCHLLRDLLYNDANHLWTRLYTAQKGAIFFFFFFFFSRGHLVRFDVVQTVSRSLGMFLEK